MNNEKLRIGLPLLIAVSIVTGMFLGYQLRDRMPWNNNSNSQSFGSPLDEVLDLIETRYVDDVNTDSLTNVSIESIVSHLDPHTQYIPAEDVEGINEDLEGRFVGIGIEFELLDDTVHIIHIIQNGPSEKAGLKTGDKLIKVDNLSVTGKRITTDSIKGLVKGAINSKVNITILRSGETKLFTISRNFIPLVALDAAYMLMPSIGYIRLNKFSETTYEEFMSALEKLQQSGLKDLVLDLRGNGGGMLNEAIEMADEFLGGDKLIVYTQGSHLAKKEYKGRRRGLFEEGKLVVLLDEGSASASEVLAGALQDWDRATIIGRRSFGKGLVQEQYDLSNGAALRITVARYFTPLGRSIQKSYTNGNESYNEEIFSRFNHNNMISDTIIAAKGKQFTSPNGKKLYAEYGIQPDIYVQFDTSSIDFKLTDIYEKNTLNNFIYKYYISNHDTFDQYKNVEDFDNGFQVTPIIYNKLIDFVKHDQLELPIFTGEEKKVFFIRLKSLFAQQIWQQEGYYKVLNATDPIVLKAIEKIKH